jgi:hypothetical protein
MPSADSQPVRTLYRIILLQTGGTEVLLVRDGTRFALPEIEIPRFARVAEHLTAAVRREWGQEILCLFSPACRNGPAAPHGVRHYVAEALGPGHCTRHSNWVPVASLTEDSLYHADDYHALCGCLARCCSQHTGPKPGPFETLGWLSEARAWIATVLQPLGLQLRGTFRQLNASPTFSLIRFETNGPAVWFKAVGEPNAREFPISRYLARFFPDFVPRILAVREDWSAWLTLDAHGTHPGQTPEIETWTTVATTLADLQMASIGSALHLIDAGCKDVRACTLRTLVDPFLQAMSGLMEQQTKLSPAPLSPSELTELGVQLKEALSSCESFELPNTLGHLDFNPGNILASPSGCVFLDWADACVGPPFCTVQYLLEHFRRSFGDRSPHEHNLVRASTERWQALFSPDEISQALAVAPLLAAFAFAAGQDRWRDPQSVSRPRVAAYFRSLTRRMKREADRWTEGAAPRRLPCLR